MTKDINYHNAGGSFALPTGIDLSNIFNAGKDWWISRKEGKTAAAQQAAAEAQAQQAAAEAEAKAKQQKTLIIAGISSIALIGIIIGAILILKPKTNGK